MKQVEYASVTRICDLNQLGHIPGNEVNKVFLDDLSIPRWYRGEYLRLSRGGPWFESPTSRCCVSFKFRWAFCLFFQNDISHSFGNCSCIDSLLLLSRRVNLKFFLWKCCFWLLSVMCFKYVWNTGHKSSNMLKLERPGVLYRLFYPQSAVTSLL